MDKLGSKEFQEARRILHRVSHELRALRVLRELCVPLTLLTHLTHPSQLVPRPSQLVPRPIRSLPTSFAALRASLSASVVQPAGLSVGCGIYTNLTNVVGHNTKQNNPEFLFGVTIFGLEEMGRGGEGNKLGTRSADRRTNKPQCNAATEEVGADVNCILDVM